MTIPDFGEVPESFFGGDGPDEYDHFVAYWLFFVFWECLEECAPVMAFGFLSFAYTSMSKFTYSCICM